MKMVKYYLIGVVLTAVLAIYTEHWLLRLLLGWIGLSLLVVSLAYLFGYPGLFRKRENGSIPLYIRWLFIPFLLGTGLYNSWARRNDKVPAVQKITDQVFLACRLFGRDIDALSEMGITAILDVTAEFDGLDWSAQRADHDYLNIPVLDHTSPSKEQLLSAINWIDQHIKQEKCVVVHCALGRGRSVLVVAAYLLASTPDLSVRDALQQIQSVRSTARLNRQQLRALTELQDDGALALSDPITVIANPVAGGGKWKTHKDDILNLLNPHFRVTVKETTSDITARQLTKEALDKHNKYIIACGGDGTVADVASALVHSETSLGIIPMGTANALSQLFHGYRSKLMPVTTACDLIIQGHLSRIDTVRCNGDIMLMVAAVGFEQQMIAHADRDKKDEGGQFAYLKGLWEALSENKNLTFSVALDDEQPRSLTTPSLVIANAAPATTALAQGKSLPNPTDGQLDITWLTPLERTEAPLLSLAELVFRTDKGKAESPRITHCQAKQITLSFDHEQSYAVDGEIRKARELVIKCIPDSLSVITRSESPASESN